MADPHSFGVAFLLVNSYKDRPNQLNPLVRIDQAYKDFWDTFHALGFRPVIIYCNLTKEQLLSKLDTYLQTVWTQYDPKYVVFHFIGHGRVGDVLFMQDGGAVLTEEIVESFHRSLPEKIFKFFFIDACRSGAEIDPKPYCPARPNTLLARSTLPYQDAYTGDTYGIWSGHLLEQLRASMQTVEETLKLVDRIVRQPTQCTNSGVPDVCWRKEVEYRGGDLQASPPALPAEFHALSAEMMVYREKLGIRSSNERLDAHGSSPTKDAVTQKAPSDGVAAADGPVTSAPNIIHSADVIKALGQQVDARWREFGTFLHCDSWLMDIIDNDKNGSTACMLALVTKWVNGDKGAGDLPRTWQTVVEAVRKLGCRKLEEELVKEYGVKAVPPPPPPTGSNTGSAALPQQGTVMTASETAEVPGLKGPPAHKTPPTNRRHDKERTTSEVSQVEVIEELSQEFLKSMNSEAIASSLRVLGRIPDKVKRSIEQCKDREDGNSTLLAYLTEDATEEQVLGVFEDASKKAGYGKMNKFAAKVLKRLQ